MKKIIINGKEYAKFKDVPQELQHLVRDENNNNMPDFIEDQLEGKNVAKNIQTAIKIGKVLMGGNFYGLDEMPPEVKTKLKETIQRFNPEAAKFIPEPQQQPEIKDLGDTVRNVILILAILALIGWFLSDKF